MHRSLDKILLFIFILMIVPTIATAEVGMEILQTLQTESEPLDAVMAPRGSYIYVLTRSGDVAVFDTSGDLQGRIHVGTDVKALGMGPTEDILFLSSPESKQVRVAEMVVIQQIDIKQSPVKGNPDAPVTVVVFSDFQCPYCSKLVPILDQIYRKYPTQIKIVFKNFPLRSHNYAKEAAKAALAAATMGKFWEFHDKLFENYNQLNDAKVERIAKDLGLDPVELKKKQESPEVRDALEQDIADARSANVRSTPSVYINGHPLRQRSVNGFVELIETELQKQKKIATK